MLSTATHYLDLAIATAITAAPVVALGMLIIRPAATRRATGLVGAASILLASLSSSTASAGSSPQLLMNDTNLPDPVRPRYQSSLAVEGKAPSLDGAIQWLNSPPLKSSDLVGKVVLVDFWTYSCINCIRTLPYVRAWAEKYKDSGLVVVGVHTPEFAFEKKLSNVSNAIAQFDIRYPVAVDSDFKIWRSFRNAYWPAFYLIDARGRLRYHQFGEGSYDQTEAAIRDLLHEAGSETQDKVEPPRMVVASENPADLTNLKSPETYLGYSQADSFAPQGGLVKDSAKNYTLAPLNRNQWSLLGNWKVKSDAAVVQQPGGEVSMRFKARDLHLVAGPGTSGKKFRFRVSLDGHPPGENHGADTDANGNGVISETRLYQLVRQQPDVLERTITIEFLDTGAQAFVFTFG